MSRPSNRAHTRTARLALGLALTVMACAAATQVQAQDLVNREPQGRTVEAIRVDGQHTVGEETILFYLATRAGQSFDWTMARQDYQTLLNTNWFSDLILRWEEGTQGGVVLVLEVEEKPRLRQVRIVGTGKVDGDDLVERMEQLERPIAVDDFIDEQRLREADEILTLMLQGEGGLQFVQVTREIVDSELGAGVDAVFNVIEGDEVRISEVMFEGVTVFSQRELRWAMKRTNEHHFLSFMNKSDRFSMAGFEADMIDISNMYRRQGFLDFNFGEPEIRVFDDDRALWWDDKQRLSLMIPIHEGPQYRIAKLDVEGNTHFEDDELLKVLDLKPGDVVNVDEIRLAQTAIEAMYTAAGYLQVATAPAPEQFPETAEANLTFRVTENDIYNVNRIEFEGNTHTREHVLRRAIHLKEDSRWEQQSFVASLQRLYQLGYFQDVTPDLQTVPPGQTPDGSPSTKPDEGAVDVKLRVQELGRNQIQFGGGLSALEGAFVQFGYTTRNLFGYGQTLSLQGQFGGRRTNARIGFSDPYVFGKRLRFGLDLFRDAIDFPDFQRSGTGFSTRLGMPTNRRESIALFVEYNYEIIDIGNVGSAFGSLSDPLFNALFLFEGRRVMSSVRPFALINTIDNPWNASRGTRTSVSYERAGGPFGGTLDFWKAIARTTVYLPTRSAGSGLIRQPKQILAINIDARYGQPTGDLEELPIFERFFLGGSNSVRGTRLRAIGPMDDRGNILGGTKALQYNLEYIFQLSSALRVSMFHDAGQAWLENESINFGEMRRSAGVQVSVFAPVFNVPFRFFWAYNFDPLENVGEETSTFEFAIGSTF